jgi:hypothetical protein
MKMMMERAFHTLRTWLGLADASEARLTPAHGWLLPAPAEALTRRRVARPPACNAPAFGPVVEA